MPFGKDQQYDLSWSELDKIKRRQEIYRRLKHEGIIKRYDPDLLTKGEIYTDPAILRYMDMRKRGRTPGAPLKPSIFFTTAILTFFLPALITCTLSEWERRPWLKAIEEGDYPREKRLAKIMY